MKSVFCALGALFLSSPALAQTSYEVLENGAGKFTVELQDLTTGGVTPLAVAARSCQPRVVKAVVRPRRSRTHDALRLFTIRHSNTAQNLALPCCVSEGL